MRLRRFALSAISLSLFPLAVAAQDAPAALERADHSILLAAGGSTNVGYWTRVGERTDLGIEGGFSFSEEEDADATAIAASLALKRYWSPATSSIAPYTAVGIRGSWTDSDALDTELQQYGAFGGIGLDWFPAQRVSVGGHLALRASLTRQTLPSFGSGEAESRDGWAIATASSGIRLRLYF